MIKQTSGWTLSEGICLNPFVTIPLRHLPSHSSVDVSRKPGFLHETRGGVCCAAEAFVFWRRWRQTLLCNSARTPRTCPPRQLATLYGGSCLAFENIIPNGILTHEGQQYVFVGEHELFRTLCDLLEVSVTYYWSSTAPSLFRLVHSSCAVLLLRITNRVSCLELFILVYCSMPFSGFLRVTVEGVVLVITGVRTYIPCCCSCASPAQRPLRHWIFRFFPNSDTFP